MLPRFVLQSLVFVVSLLSMCLACTPPSPPPVQPQTCQASQTLCGDLCIFLERDPHNCGSCGKACASQEICLDGKCTLSCPSSQTLCSDACVSLQTDTLHCGACGKACSNGQRCDEGRCFCTSGLTSCKETCVDLQSHLTHCGTCDHACPSDEICVQGRCLAACPPQTPSLCFGSCVDLQQDASHCGACGKACLAGETCKDGACSCPTGLTKCGKACVDLQKDPKHCGLCDSPCSDATFCKSGSCSNACPSATPTVCFNRCVDTQTDAEHCGICGIFCNPDEACHQGKCQCPASSQRCKNRCTDLQTDPSHCGACDQRCDSRQSCTQGICILDCPPLQTACGDQCFDLKVEKNHCGACGRTCARHDFCQDGGCLACPDGVCKGWVRHWAGSPSWRDGSASQALFFQPYHVVFDPQGNAYVADAYNHRIRKIDTAGQVTTIAGTGVYGFQDGPALQAQFRFPIGLALDPSGFLYIADYNNYRIRKLDLQKQTISTLIGIGVRGYQDGDVLQARLGYVFGLALDSLGNLYLADSGNHAIRRFEMQSQTISTLAGAGASGHQDGPLQTALFNFPYRLTFDTAGNLYVADKSNHRLRKIDLQGIVTTIAGAGTEGFKDGPAAAALLRFPSDLAFDASGHLLFVDTGNNRIRKLDLTTQTITTVAGSGSSGLQDGAALAARLNEPSGMAFHPTGSLYLTETGNHRLRKLDFQTQQVSTFAGSSFNGYRDGSLATSLFSTPRGIAFDKAGALYVAEVHRLRKIDPQTQEVSTLAGSASSGLKDGPSPQALFTSPTHLAFDSQGELYIADSGNHRLRKLDPQTQTVSTVAGIGQGWRDGSAIQAQFNGLLGIAFDSQDNLYIADTNNHRIRMFDKLSQSVTTIAGEGTQGFRDGPAAQALFAYPTTLALDPKGNLYIADYTNSRIRRWDRQTNLVSTVAGDGVSSYLDGPALKARFRFLYGLVFHSDGHLYVADSGNYRIRKIDLQTQTVSTVTGLSTSGHADGLLSEARFTFPYGLAASPSGFFALSDRDTHAIFLFR